MNLDMRCLTGKCLALLVSAGVLFAMASRAWATLPQGGDVVLGLSNSNAAATLQLIRGPATLNGGVAQTVPWTSTPFIETVQFDNLGGTLHNAHGNLLGVDFGTSPTGATPLGGQIFSFATTGTDPAPAAHLLADTGTGLGGIGNADASGKTRIGEVAVSPDNTKVAATFYDAGVVGLYNYTADNGAGTGTPSLTGGQVSAGGIIDVTSTQGVAWKDNSTILTYSAGKATPGTAFLYKVDATTLAPTLAASITVPPVAASFTSIAYNPQVSKYVYLMFGAGNSLSTAFNQLDVLDPTNNYASVKEVFFDANGGTTTPNPGGMNTSRSIALDASGNLFISEFGGGANPTDNAIIDVVPGAGNPASLTNNSAIDWALSTTHANFPGLDVGLAAAGVQGDYNGNGIVDAADYTVWRDHLGQSFALPNRDTTNSGVINAQDYTFWVSRFGAISGAGSLGVGAVPEPASLAMLLIGAVGLWAGRCRGARD